MNEAGRPEKGQPEPGLPRTPIRPFSLFSGHDLGLVIVIVLSVGSAITVLAREGGGVALGILTEDFYLFLTILPKVMLGCLIGALVRLLIARETIEKHVGRESGLRGLAVASLIGMLFPAGPFTIFPLAVVLIGAGGDRGTAIAFVSAWLLIGINRAIIWEMPFFGADFVLYRFAISLPMPILLGLAARLPIFETLSPSAGPTSGDGKVR